MVELKVRKLGNSLGTLLPKDVVDHLGLAEGDRLFLVENKDGYRLTPYDPAFEEQMRIAEAGMGRYRNTLRKLAE